MLRFCKIRILSLEFPRFPIPTIFGSRWSVFPTEPNRAFPFLRFHRRARGVSFRRRERPASFFFFFKKWKTPRLAARSWWRRRPRARPRTRDALLRDPRLIYISSLICIFPPPKARVAVSRVAFFKSHRALRLTRLLLFPCCCFLTRRKTRVVVVVVSRESPRAPSRPRRMGPEWENRRMVVSRATNLTHFFQRNSHRTRKNLPRSPRRSARR